MRLNTKFKTFFTIFIAGGLLGESALYFWLLSASMPDHVVNWAVVLFLVLWVAAFGLIQHFFMRCPNCGNYALLPPGVFSPQPPGARCKYCGVDY